MSIQVFSVYCSILLIATITPGPSMLLALNHGINHGLSKTLYSCTGNVSGNLLMALVSLSGLGAVLAISGALFNIIKIAGAVYLIYIGLKMILNSGGTDNPGRNINTEKQGTGSLFIEGFIIAIGNPKGILFFTALFPQFININNASVKDFFIIFTMLGIVAFTCYMLYAAAGLKLKVLFSISAFRKRFNVISGMVMAGSGIALALSERNK